MYASRDADGPLLPPVVFQFGLVMVSALIKEGAGMRWMLLDCVAECWSSGCESKRKTENLFKIRNMFHSLEIHS